MVNKKHKDSLARTHCAVGFVRSVRISQQRRCSVYCSCLRRRPAALPGRHRLCLQVYIPLLETSSRHSMHACEGGLLPGRHSMHVSVGGRGPARTLDNTFNRRSSSSVALLFVKDTKISFLTACVNFSPLWLVPLFCVIFSSLWVVPYSIFL